MKNVLAPNPKVAEKSRSLSLKGARQRRLGTFAQLFICGRFPVPVRAKIRQIHGPSGLSAQSML
jgi:hypothetical protein